MYLIEENTINAYATVYVAAGSLFHPVVSWDSLRTHDDNQSRDHPWLHVVLLTVQAITLLKGPPGGLNRQHYRLSDEPVPL